MGPERGTAAGGLIEVAESSELTVAIIAREAFRLLWCARNVGLPIFSTPEHEYVLWNSEQRQQWGILFFLPQWALKWGLGKFGEEVLFPKIVSLARSIPKVMGRPTREMECPQGVESSAMASSDGLRLRAVLVWEAVDHKGAPSSSWSEIRDYYNIEIDHIERRACALALRLDVTKME